MNRVTCVKNKNYATISNVFLRDKNISLKAKGLLAMIFALPNDWDFSINGLLEIIKEGKTATYSTIDELKQHGYCSVVTLRNDIGVIVGNDYTFFEMPHSENPYAENPHVDNQTQQNIVYTKDNNIPKKKEQNKEEIENILKDKELFEKCWLAYKRKGNKKKAREYWNKLTDVERQNVLPHIKPYVASRELQYQKDFERYLRDKIFLNVVISNNNIIYDPTKLGKGESATQVYMPSGNFSIMWNEPSNAYMYIGYYYDGYMIADGYTDSNRPNGAKLILNNGRGTITWNCETKTWDKV